jgi:hypothetical protein
MIHDNQREAALPEVRRKYDYSSARRKSSVSVNRELT